VYLNAFEVRFSEFKK